MRFQAWSHATRSSGVSFCSSPLTLKGQGSIDLIVDNLPVTNGDYTFDLAIHRPDGFNYDFRRDICTLHIAGRTQTPGEIALPHRWEIR